MFLDPFDLKPDINPEEGDEHQQYKSCNYVFSRLHYSINSSSDQKVRGGILVSNVQAFN
jgi:hypothetical protein